MDTSDIPAQPERRSFFKKAGAGLFATVALLSPVAAGLASFLAPVRRKTKAGGFVRITSLQALPADGRPVKLLVISNRTDAWTRSPDMPIGAIYLRRTGPESVTAFNIACPHAGCFVEYRADLPGFLCPCHNSSFALDGKINSPGSPAPRGLDELEVQIREGGEVWVKFQNFRAGTAEKSPA